MSKPLRPKLINAIGTLEFFTHEGDSPDDVKIKLMSDFGRDVDPDIREHMSNVQFGVFYEFLNDEYSLANTGKIFRAGITFGQRNNPSGGYNGPPREPPKDKPSPTPDKPEVVKDLEKLLREDD